MIDILKKDLYRYGKCSKLNLYLKKEVRWLINFRKLQSCNNIFKIVYYLKYKRLTSITGIQIPIKTKIGEGFYIGHCGRIIINPNTVLGRNINIATGVTIGQENRGKRKGTPIIGDNVWIGTNAVIVGNIKIGNDVIIAPLSYVNFDVPDHSIVIGNPGKIINREQATKDYINNVV